MNTNKKSKKGFSMVEAVVAIAIVSGFIVVLGVVNSAYLQLSFGESDKIQASFLSEEGLEAMRFLRDESFKDNILPLYEGVDYYLYFSGSYFEPTTTQTYVG